MEKPGLDMTRNGVASMRKEKSSKVRATIGIEWQRNRWAENCFEKLRNSHDLQAQH